MTEKELLIGFLSKTVNMDDAGVASLYNEDGSELKADALDTLLKLDVDRVQKLKPDTKKLFDDGYKKGQSESLTKIEKDFQDRTGFKSDKKGVELFIDYAAVQAKQSGSELTEDAIKKHPLYISTVERIQKEKDDAVNAELDKFNKFQTELKTKETFSSVSQKAMDLFDSWKPILSKDPERARNQKTDFVEKLKSYDYEIQGDKIIVLKDGKVIEDGHGNRVPFDKIVRQTSDMYYDYHQAEQRSSAGNGKDNGDSGKKAFSFEVPKTDTEYAQMISDPKRPVDERLAIQEAYKKTQTIQN